MADLYGDMETRVPVTLGPSPEDALSEIALWGARTGARGGTLTGRGLRGAAGAASRLPGDPLAADRGNLGAAFASDNPYVAATYAGPKGKVYPFRINPDELFEARHGGWGERMVRPTSSVWQDTVHLWKPAPEGPVSALDYKDMELPPELFTRDPTNFPRRAAGRMTGAAGLRDALDVGSWNRPNWPRGFSTAAGELPPGRAQVARNVTDPGPKTVSARQWDRAGLWQAPSEQWAYGPGTAVESAGPALTTRDLAALQAQGLDSERFARAVPHWAAEEGLATTSQAEGLLSAWDKDLLIDQVRDDPRFTPGEGRLLFRGLDPDRALPKPPLASRIGKGLLRFGKAGLHPAGILADALLGSAAGGGGAAAGYASASPETGGTISIPSGSDILREIPSDPLRGGVVGQETMLRAIMAADERKEALRQQYIDEINAQYGPGTVQQGAKIDEISRYLGPVAF